MKQQLRRFRDNIAAISTAVRASSEYTRAAARADGQESKARSSLSGIPI
ncbi:hypothetical protein ACFSE1_13685 [Rhizobium helianthi]|uniref:Uncharacterized protein n=1 Tax=Rhizobium helianthi TaxID=1132695 RepID=A0ABW4M7J9_9HYPH